MAFCTVQFKGESIRKDSSMCVIVPEKAGPHPVLYLLHGLSDDHTAWRRRTSLERYLTERSLIVVLPDGHRSFYVNQPGPRGLAYEDHIIRDVVGFVDRTFPTIAARRGRAVAGQSMGGYGALMLAMRHPEMFSAASAHSAALSFAHDPIEDRPDVNALAENLPPREYDCFALAEKLRPGAERPAIRFDCGADDFLLDWNQAFHAHLDRLGIDHEYVEHPGGHSWDYWDAHLPQTLEFVLRHLQGA